MSRKRRDRSLDVLLDLDGQVFVVDPAGKHWVKFSVQRVAPSPEKPHGLNYSLTLHDEQGRRLVGFDNAHSVRSASGSPGRRRKQFDHKHDTRRARPYEYQDAVSLLADFWSAVDEVLRKKGII